MGRHFWVGRGCFSWGGGGGRESARARSAGSVAGRHALSNSPFFCYILYVEQWKFRCSISSGHREGGPRSSFALGRHVHCFRPRQNVDLYHALKTAKGLLPLVPPRTPRSSGYDVMSSSRALLLYVYVCYMLLYVICL